MKQALVFLIRILTLIATTLPVLAQQAQRHPRVLEVEKMLHGEIQSTLRDLIPGESFTVRINVDPLHRQSSTAPNKETLPYFEASDEIKDEWDNPNKTDYELLTRVNRISVKAIVPSSLSAQQVADIKQAITYRIPHVEARDLIEVEQRTWPQTSQHTQYTSWILGIGLVLMLILGVIYFAVSYTSLGRISKAITNIKMAAGDANGSAPSPSFLPPQGPVAAAVSNGMGAPSGMMQINDTIRMTEVISNLVKGFEASKSFPTLEDMILLESYLRLHPSAAGVLLTEFPSSLKTKLFSLSYSEHWLKALTHPGEINAISFELANKLSRIDRDLSSPAWNEFLILCWRLESRLPQLLKRIEAADRFTILQALPQSIALQAARELMPGEWALVLKRSAAVKPLSEEKVAKYRSLAEEISPLRPVASLEQFKKDADLIHFLKFADPEFEKEIYGAVPKESTLSVLRPPFFPLLEAGVEDLKEFANLVSMEEWSLALLNIPKNARTNIDRALSEKQKMRLSELFRRHDRAGTSIEAIGEARERLGQIFKNYQATLVARKPLISSVIEHLTKEAA